jgi:hypothetical protein
MQHLTEENVTASLGKRKTIHDLGASDSEVTLKTMMTLPAMY